MACCLPWHALRYHSQPSSGSASVLPDSVRNYWKLAGLAFMSRIASAAQRAMSALWFRIRFNEARGSAGPVPGVSPAMRRQDSASAWPSWAPQSWGRGSTPRRRSWSGVPLGMKPLRGQRMSCTGIGESAANAPAVILLQPRHGSGPALPNSAGRFLARTPTTKRRSWSAAWQVMKAAPGPTLLPTARASAAPVPIKIQESPKSCSGIG